MRFKLIARCLLFAGLCVCLTSGEMLLREAFAAHHKPTIVFTTFRDGNAEIYGMTANGKKQTRLTDHPAADLHPSWSPDGKKIAFTSYRNGGNRQIFVMDSDGQNPIRLTDEVWDVDPHWSPDGQKIAFTGHKDVGVHGEAWEFDIYVIDPDGKNRKKITHIAGNNSNPTWSPDSQRIAFVNSGWGRGWGSEIYVMDSNGENTTRLTDDDGSKRHPAWSPDGQSIAFMFKNQVCVMDSDGENLRKLTDGHFYSKPTWSSDSEMIAYESWRRHDHISEIHLMTADGKHIRKLSRPPERGDYDPDWFNSATLAASPAGNQITIWGRLKKLAPTLR